MGKQAEFLPPNDVTVLDQVTSSVGGMRLWFQMRAPVFMLDQEGKKQRLLLRKKGLEGGIGNGVSRPS